MMTKLRTRFSKELMEKLDEMGYIDFTGYMSGGEPPEYIDVGYAFISLTANPEPQKFLGIFESKADASREIGQKILLDRAKGLVHNYDEACLRNSSWLYSEADTWNEPMET